MNKQPKDNSGAAFPRDQKGNPKAPNYSGPVLVEGKEYQISIWEKTSKNGNDYLSLSFGPPYKKGKSDSDIPF
jgi:hypothetical protein